MILIINNLELETLNVNFNVNSDSMYFSSIITYDSVTFEINNNRQNLQIIDILVGRTIKKIIFFSEHKFFNCFNCLITDIKSKNNLTITLSFDYYNFDEDITLLRKFKIKKLL